MISLPFLLTKIEPVIREAGQILLRAHVDRSEIIQKSGHKNFVTLYDKEIQSFLEAKLKEIHPEAAFYAEEDDSHNESMLETGDVFVIDPIDGTSNFMKGYYPSCISIGLMREGRPSLGMIYVPQTDDLFQAVRGEGAYHNGKRIFSSDEPLEESLMAFGTAPYYEELHEKAFQTAAWYLKRCIDIRRSGSAAYDLCMVACGRIGVYAEPVIQLWDFAAGGLIAEEAGAKVTDWEGNPLSYREPSGVLAVSRGIAKLGG